MVYITSLIYNSAFKKILKTASQITPAVYSVEYSKCNLPNVVLRYCKIIYNLEPVRSFGGHVLHIDGMINC